jgi:hypothetical protein
MTEADMPDLDDDTRRLHCRLAELGPDAVRQLLASDGFPRTHRLTIARWLACQAAADAPDHRK